jgi:DNA-directed RNA polymerase specialized sigma24 family protein
MCPQNTDFLNALKQRSRIAFNDLYDCYAPTLFGIITEMVDTQPQAEAILRDTFVTIWKNIHLYDPDKGRFFLWLVHIARTTTIASSTIMQEKGAKGLPTFLSSHHRTPKPSE